MSSLICLASQCPEGAITAPDVVRTGIALFLAIVFLQSGLDKIFDWKGNLDWLREFFASSPLAGSVPPLLLVVTIAETAAGLLSVIGVGEILLAGTSVIAAWGALLSAISLLMVLLGQRLAKAYADAAVIAPYFLVASLGIWLLGQ